MGGRAASAVVLRVTWAEVPLAIELLVEPLAVVSQTKSAESSEELLEEWWEQPQRARFDTRVCTPKAQSADGNGWREVSTPRKQLRLRLQPRRRCAGKTDDAAAAADMGLDRF